VAIMKDGEFHKNPEITRAGQRQTA